MAICEQVTELRDHLHAASRQGFDRPVDVESNQKRSHSSLGDRLPARFSGSVPFRGHAAHDAPLFGPTRKDKEQVTSR